MANKGSGSDAPVADASISPVALPEGISSERAEELRSLFFQDQDDAVAQTPSEQSTDLQQEQGGDVFDRNLWMRFNHEMLPWVWVVVNDGIVEDYEMRMIMGKLNEFGIADNDRNRLLAEDYLNQAIAKWEQGELEAPEGTVKVAAMKDREKMRHQVEMEMLDAELAQVEGKEAQVDLANQQDVAMTQEAKKEIVSEKERRQKQTMNQIMAGFASVMGISTAEAATGSLSPSASPGMQESQDKEQGF